MKLSRVFIRGFSDKIQRSHNDSVKLNIQLSHSVGVKEIFKIVVKNSLSPSQQTFVLRMIAKIIRLRTDQIFELVSPMYYKFCKEIEANIPIFQSFEICDVCFWLRYTRLYPLKDLTEPGLEQLISKIYELEKNNSFTNRQLVTLLFDTNKIGIPLLDIMKKLNDKFVHAFDFFVDDDFKQILQVMNTQRFYIQNQNLLDIIKRIENLLEKEFLITNACHFLFHTVKIKNRSYFNSLNPFINKITKKIFESIHEAQESDFFHILVLHYFEKFFSYEEKEKVLEVISKNIFDRASDYSEFFISNIFSLICEFEKNRNNLIQFMKEEIIKRINSKSYTEASMSKFFTALYDLDIHSKQVYDLLISDQFLPYYYRKNVYEASILITKHSGESELKKCIIDDSRIRNWSKAKKMKAKLYLIDALEKQSENVDSLKIKLMLIELLEEHINASVYNAINFLNILGITENKNFRLSGLDHIKKLAVSKLIDSKYSISNFYILSASCKDLEKFESYLRLHKSEINRDISAEILGHYIYELEYAVLNLICSYFPEQHEFRLLDLIQYSDKLEANKIEQDENRENMIIKAITSINPSTLVKMVIFQEQCLRILNFLKKNKANQYAKLVEIECLKIKSENSNTNYFMESLKDIK